VKAFNTVKGTWLASDLEVADSFWRRLVGLLGRRSLAPSGGLWISPCHSIHTLGMLFSIDVLFLDSTGRIVKALKAVKPFRLVLPVKSATSVLELPAQTIDRTGTETGDVIQLRA